MNEAELIDSTHKQRLQATKANGGSFEFRMGKFMNALFAERVTSADRIDAAKAINVALGVEEDDQIIKQYADNKKKFLEKLTAGIKGHKDYKPENLEDLLKHAIEKTPTLPDSNPLKKNPNRDEPARHAYIKLRPGETSFEYPGNIKLIVTNINNQLISVRVTDKTGKILHAQEEEGEGKKLVCNHDFKAQGLFTIGRKIGHSLTIDASSHISFNQAHISLVDGEIIYTHTGSNDILNPLFPRPLEITGVIGGSKASAGGFTHENRVYGNFDVTNYTRACIGAAPNEVDDPKGFLQGVFKHVIEDIASPKDGALLNGSSNLSIAMRAGKEDYVCAYMGNSPFYLVMQIPESKNIILKQVTAPHPTPQAHRDTSKYLDRAITTATLPTIAIISPEEEFRSHKDAKLHKNPRCLGILVCSNGICEGVKYHMVDKGLTDLLTETPDATAAQIAKCAAEAALPAATTSITAMFLPADGKGMVAVAEGFDRTTEVADSALTSIVNHIHYMSAKRHGSDQVRSTNIRESSVDDPDTDRPAPPTR